MTGASPPSSRPSCSSDTGKEAYYGINIAIQPRRNWTRLEDDSTIMGRIRSEVHVAGDMRNDPRNPHKPRCTDQTTRDRAVEVGERVVSDFIWQRNPWGLYSEGHPELICPGVDYLLAYGMGRYYGFISDDTPGKCLAWH